MFVVRSLEVESGLRLWLPGGAAREQKHAKENQE
jgi:hypothetical protein